MYLTDAAGVTVVSDTSSSLSARVRWEFNTGGTYYLRAVVTSWSSSTGYSYRLEDMGVDDHGDTLATATPIVPSTTYTNAKFEVSGDVDWFSFTAEAGHIYEHGGLSLQECVIPMLSVSAGDTGRAAGRIVDVSWIGLRCRISVDAAPDGAVVDLRRSPGLSESSIVIASKPVTRSDEGAVLVPDDSLEGESAYAVLLSDEGAILSQVSTRVGG